MTTSIAVPSPSDARRHDRGFFTGLAVAATAVAFIGFARTYFLKAWFGTPPIPAALHLHGALMTLWLVVLIAQVWLVAARRADLHRRLGVVGGVLAAAIVVSSVFAALVQLRAHRGMFAFEPTAILVSLGSVIQFGAFVSLALVYRRKAEAHKRLIFLATTALLTAAVGRVLGVPIVGILGVGPRTSIIVAIVVCAVSDLLVAAMVVYDLVTRRRVHSSLVWGGVALVITQVAIEAVRHTAPGLALAVWLQS